MINIDVLNSINIDFDIKPDISHYMFLAKKDKIDFIYNTSALEGNAMSYPEVQTLLEGITVGGHKLSDEKMILNQNKSVELLFEMIEKKEFILNKSTLLKLHFKVSYEEALKWGEFRDGNVNIGGSEYKPPHFDKLDDIFNQEIEKINLIKEPLIRAISYFLFGAKSQFFYDGNKRVSRLMCNGILLSSGYPALNIKVKDRLEFNKKMLSFYDDDSNFIGTLGYLMDYYKQQNLYLIKG